MWYVWVCVFVAVDSNKTKEETKYLACSPASPQLLALYVQAGLEGSSSLLSEKCKVTMKKNVPKSIW